MFTLVGMPNCVKCKEIEGKLKNLGYNNVKYIDGTKNMDIVDKYNIQGVPVIINEETNVATYVAGFSNDKLKALLG